LPKSVNVELHLVNEPVDVHGDRNQIDQALINVVLNASDAMPDGGKIEIQTRNVVLDEDDCSSLYGVRPGKYAQVVVSDNGRGMDSSTLERIFERFFSTKERGSIRGTGLGLSVVQGIIESHGGFVTCQSELGKGTIFKICLPAVSRGNQ
jgi:signal transduction histidine kinase